MSKKLNYPYQKTELESLPHERWDDIPGLDGYYEISTFGRIKRLYREVLTSDGKVMRFQERIIRSFPDKQYNKTVDEYNFHLSANLTIEGRTFKIAVARIVYYVFKKKFDLEDMNLVVIAKDGDGKNIRLSNLQLADIKRKAARIFKRGRLKREIVTTWEEFKKTGKKLSDNPFCRQVSQYSYDGKYIATFPSIRVASKVTGVSERGIVAVLKGRQIRVATFHWAYGNTKKSIDLNEIREKHLKGRRKLVGRVVTMYDTKGNRIGIFDSVASATEYSGVRGADIQAAISGRQKSAGGYIWTSGSGAASISVKGQHFGEELRASRRMIPVGKYSVEGKLIKKYKSINALAEEKGCTASNMTTVINKQKLYKGYFYKKLSKSESQS